MTITERVDKAREIAQEIRIQDKAEKVYELADKGLSLLGNQDLDEEGIKVKVDILGFVIQVYAMNHRGDLAFPYLLSFRQLVEVDGKIATAKEFAFLLSICLPELAEIEALTDQELEGLIKEVKQSIDEAADNYSLAFILLEVYQKRSYTAKADELKVMLLDKAVPVQEEDRNCESCIQNVKIVKQLQLGRIKEAEQTMQKLMNIERFKCARSPRTAARALLNYYLEQGDLERAKPHADLLAEYIDFGWPGSIYFANPLFEYLVRTSQEEEAQFWYKRFEEEMRTTLLSLEKARFWKWSSMLSI